MQEFVITTFEQKLGRMLYRELTGYVLRIPAELEKFYTDPERRPWCVKSSWRRQDGSSCKFWEARRLNHKRWPCFEETGPPFLYARHGLLSIE